MMKYRIKEIRRAKEMTLSQLAERAGITPQLLLALEDGRIKLVTTETLLNVAEALETSVDDLFCL